MTNPELELAFNFVEKTNRNIFLTGKAGTGKTTFLQNIKKQSRKRLVVVAPTGVAAINAKGVTIHSFFQMPFGPILPEHDPRRIKNQFQRKFNREKINIIRSLDLLIIDEISMVRADLLDGIDQVLRKYKSRNQVFGGVQVLMIGDLQQLSPVVKPHEWDLLKNLYENAFFFSSRAFQQSNAIGIELKHIYRQADEKFIGILNEIRNNRLSEVSAKILNERHDPTFSPKENEGYITLTTHNNRANAINEQELQKLKGKTYVFKAKIEGKFNEHAYPTHEKLELKKGAQVMFIKNDSSGEKLYYNGKIGKITAIGKKIITVLCPGDDHEIDVKEETWENSTYIIDEETKEISTDLVGSFTQIPLRLAWSITIHKSQGLTFEKAIIDAEASFAHGQTYVALSRCKSLEGIVLKTPIKSRSIISDQQVNVFTKNVEDNQPDQKELKLSEKAYELNMIADLFNYYEFTYPLKRLVEIYYKNKRAIEGNVLDKATSLKETKIPALMKVSYSFQKQVESISTGEEKVEENTLLQERLQKAMAYFTKFTQEELKAAIDSISFETDNKKVKKDLNAQLDKLNELVDNKLYCLEGLKAGFTVSKYLGLKVDSVMKKPKKRKSSIQEVRGFTSTEHPELFQELKELRHVLAEAEEVAHYQVFTQKSLYEMCTIFPTTFKSLEAINGMGKVRVKKYGKKIVETIQDYVEKNKIEPRKPKETDAKPQKRSGKETSFELFIKGKSMEEIATQQGYVRSTIEGHLASFVESGDLDITDLMDEQKYHELKTVMQKTEYKNFSDLKYKIDDKFRYFELRLVAKELEK